MSIQEIKESFPLKPSLADDCFTEYEIFWHCYFVRGQRFEVLEFTFFHWIECNFYIRFRFPYVQSSKAESTKEMEQTLRAKVKIFFKSENLKKCF